MYQRLISLPRALKAAILLTVDLILVVLSFWLALSLRLNDFRPNNVLQGSSDFLIILLCTAVVAFFLLQLNSVKLGTYGTHSARLTAIWVAVVAGVGAVANTTLGLEIPRTVPAIFAALLLIGSVSFRMAAIAYLNRCAMGGRERVPVAIYGAGAAGVQLLSALRNEKRYGAVAFVDDNHALQGLVTAGLKVYPPEKLRELIAQKRIDHVFLAIPSLGKNRRRDILAQFADTGVDVRILPSFVEMLDKGTLVESLRPVDPEDLLGRDKVLPDMPEIVDAYEGRSIMVTGAGGSIGSELCRQILGSKPRRLVLFEHSEFALYAIENELRAIADVESTALVPILGSVNDAEKVRRAFVENEVDVVLHAAAYKHVPLIEANPEAGVINNVFGTRVVAAEAMRAGVRRFILVSTDKAVRPTNVMGASKRLAELVVQDLQTRSISTIFSMVRFGNVLGSSGSVIPLFRKQIADGGPITLTDAEVTRFFMTIPEAARLVLLAGSFAKGGEVFLLDMGQPVRIYDLARRMVELSGLSIRDDANPDGDIEISITGLRPGEKLYEELLIDAETLPTPHPKILRAREGGLSEIELARITSELKAAIDAHDVDAVRAALRHSAVGYGPPAPSLAGE